MGDNYGLMSDLLLKIGGTFLLYLFGGLLLFHIVGGGYLLENNEGLYVIIIILILAFCLNYAFKEYEDDIEKSFKIRKQQALDNVKMEYQEILQKNNDVIEDILKEKNQIGIRNNHFEGIIENYRKEIKELEEKQARVIKDFNKIKDESVQSGENNENLRISLEHIEKEKEWLEKEHAEKVSTLNNKIKKLEEDGVLSNYKFQTIVKEINDIKKEKDLYKNSLLEKSKFFPSLLNIIEEYQALKDQELEDYLRYKKNPSKKGAELVAEQTKKRRVAEHDLKKAVMLTEYYESIAPFLLELKEDLEIPDESILEDYSEEEREDYVTKYISKEEYRKLPSVERNQMALDRFWNKPNKSNWLIGLLYERYVGYLYEREGYDVKYHGAKEGKKDLGRDLICEKGDEILIVQCKHWSQFKTIHEKHVFQLFGTVFQYRYQFKKENKNKKIKAIFYTSTKLSDIARTFAKELEIEVKENIKLDRKYPCIKCNIGRTSEERIYHLPFDQQYDNIVIEPRRGEFYCDTVKEAEEKGFRKAFRYKGVANAA